MLPQGGFVKMYGFVLDSLNKPSLYSGQGKTKALTTKDTKEHKGGTQNPTPIGMKSLKSTPIWDDLG